MNDESAEHDLLVRAVEGDRPALEELLLAYYDRLARRLARKLPASLRSTISEEDVLQQTYAEVFQRIGSFEPKGSRAFYAWLVAIAEHRLQDTVRARQRQKRGGGQTPVVLAPKDAGGSVDQLIDLLAGSLPTPSRCIARDEAVAAIRVGLASLNEDHRRCLELRYLQGLPVAEAAEAMNIKPRALRDLSKRARDELRMVLGRSTKFFSRK
jgi:RNA polymerase sigma-70 factor (ECF subfamily)